LNSKGPVYMRKALKALLLLPLIYLLVVAGFFAAMCQSPAIFSSVMARTPDIAFMILPFRPMWLSARAGRLKVGDEAPDLSLESYDGRSDFKLSALRRKRPVVLVFGSYT
jgi:hypothetical protein